MTDVPGPRPPQERRPVCTAGIAGLELSCRCGAELPTGALCGAMLGAPWASLAEQADAMLTYAASVHASAGRLVGRTDDMSGTRALARSRHGRAIRIEAVAQALLRLPDEDVDAQLVELIASGMDIDTAIASLRRETSAGPDTEAVPALRRAAAARMIDADAVEPAADRLLSHELSELRAP